MSRDIRSFFKPISTSLKKSNDSKSKTQKKRVISSDEDEQSEPSTKRCKIKQKVKKAFISSDSEDDITSEHNAKQSKISKKNENEKSCKAVSPRDLFGKKAISRVEETKINRKLQKMESEFHNDNNFDAVLKQLDIAQTRAVMRKDKDSIENADNSSNQTNQTNKIKIKETKKSPSKDNNVQCTITCSPPKQKLQEEKKDSLIKNLDASSKNPDDIFEKLNFQNLPNISVLASVSKDINDEKQLPNNKKQNKTVDLFEERIKKKKQRAIIYEKYLHRGGARNPGSKTIPTGAKNCLAGISFLITGVLDSLERNEVEDLIRNYGGRTVNAVSGKVNYIIVGDEAGPAKLIKATSLGIKQISEDDLLEMIRTKPEGRPNDIKPISTKTKSNTKKISNKTESDKSPSPSKWKEQLISPKKEKILAHSPTKMNTLLPISKLTSNMSNNSQEETMNVGSQSLVEKYRPKTMKQIIGQQGDKSCAHNLYIWLRDWYKNRQDSKFKDGSGKQTNRESFKAALLSGPPGIGKTTTVQVVCRDLGYKLFQCNASDTRNKTSLKEEISKFLINAKQKCHFVGTKLSVTSKHALLMDEVDGMAGNEDRGGLQELINLIKYTEMPIICICNDRFNTKVKTLACHSYDLKFPKLRVEQIRSSMKSLCYKENIKISTEDLDRLIESTNYDIRQVINHLEFLGGKTIQVETTDRKHSNKNFKLGPFDVVKIAFNTVEQKNMSLNDKIGLYFHDYNIAPLFVQENYPNVKISQTSPLQRLERIACAADSISQGDLIEKVMRSNMMWSLLPLHACFSFVIPGSEMSGNLDSLVRFPGWFGRNSKATKFNRLMQELTTHTRLATSANKDALNLDYLIYIRNAIIKPLIDNGADGIKTAVNVMGKYHLMREDLDSMLEISSWPGIRDSTNNLDSKVKAAFTRAYQKHPPMLPYAINNNSTAKKRSTQDDDFIEEEEEKVEELEEDNIESDKMVKVKKPASSTNKAATSSKRNSEPAKKRGRGRGKVK